MKRNQYALICLVLIFIFPLTIPAKNSEKKVVAKRSEGPIKIDGRLEETIWHGAGYDSFTQSEPHDGKPPTERTVFWVAYDNKAIYVAARMYDSEPGKITARLGRRDDFVDSDWFIFSIDPYYDRRSGYQFAVSPAGSMVDWTIYNDEFSDTTWDGIWESAARIDDKGWTMEMRIPYNQLRFKKKEMYTWGVNFRRLVYRKQEMTWFAWVPQEESGFVSHFATLTGINNINPGKLVELTPFTASKAAFTPKEEGNPFATGSDLTGNAGVDVKVGLRSNLTLDLTLNPDFGQVEVDPAVINLSAAETYYEERRPFFIEGSSIFNFGRGGSNSHWGVNWAGPQFFYSRRIGRPPQTSAETDGYVEHPEWTTILAAAKITGKLGQGWNLGVVSALTEREYANIDENGISSKQVVEPFSYYGVLRAQKEINKGRQGLGIMATSVLRDLNTEPLQHLLKRNAFSVAIDGWTFLDKDKTWVITGWLGGTQVTGSEEVITNLQKSYMHYFQRPDATHLRLDTQATSLSGWAGRILINKQRGNFLFNAAVGAISPGFDSTDLGFQFMGDIINAHVMVGYRILKPGKLLRSWSLYVFTQRNYDFDGNKIGEQRLILFSNIQLLNYWTVYFQMSHNPERWNRDLTRGGPLTLNPTYTWFDFNISSDSRKALVASISGHYYTGVEGDTIRVASIGLRWKPKSNISLSVTPEYTWGNSTAQWVTKIDDPMMTATYGSRYIFADIDQKTLSCTIRLNWIFTPRLSLQAYIQPFIAVGAYRDFKELARPKSYDFNIYGQGNSTISFEEDVYTVDPDGASPAPAFAIGNPDFNYKSLRGTIVLRWEYRLGSILYFVWTQNRSDYANPGDLRFGRDLRHLLNAPGDNIFMVKFTYRFQL